MNETPLMHEFERVLQTNAQSIRQYIESHWDEIAGHPADSIVMLIELAMHYKKDEEIQVADVGCLVKLIPQDQHRHVVADIVYHSIQDVNLYKSLLENGLVEGAELIQAAIKNLTDKEFESLLIIHNQSRHVTAMSTKERREILSETLRQKLQAKAKATINIINPPVYPVHILVAQRCAPDLTDLLLANISPDFDFHKCLVFLAKKERSAAIMKVFDVMPKDENNEIIIEWDRIDEIKRQTLENTYQCYNLHQRLIDQASTLKHPEQPYDLTADIDDMTL